MKSFKSITVGLLLGFAVAVTLVWAAGTTTKLTFNKTDSRDMNSNLNKIDSLLGAVEDCQVILTTAGDPTEAGATDTITAADINENAISSSELGTMSDWIIFCGENDENGTIYHAPIGS